MLNVKYDFSSVHVNVPHPLCDQIISWGKKQIKDKDIYVTQKDPTFGREDEIHATILYGIHTESPERTINLLKDQGPIKARMGKVGIFSNPNNYDVIMIQIESDDLKRLNKLIVDHIPHTNKYGVYKPHITVAYVKKGKGWKHFGASKWNGTEFECNHAVFSSKDGSKHKFLI
jgi:hypothetical protein